jgi:hypothetical protein
MVQVPAAIKVTVELFVPVVVQTAVVAEEKVGANPLEAVAFKVKVPVPMVLLGRAPKVIVWFTL